LREDYRKEGLKMDKKFNSAKEDIITANVQNENEEIFEEIEEIVTAGLTGCSNCCN
jgi:hypothetical protein